MDLLDPLDIECPYCGEVFEIAIDPGEAGEADFIVDCEICCQPIRVRLRRDGSREFERAQ